MSMDNMNPVPFEEIMKQFGMGKGSIQVYGNGKVRCVIPDTKTVILNHKNDTENAFMLLMSGNIVFRIIIKDDDFVVYHSKLDEAFDKSGHQLVTDEELKSIEKVW